MYQDVHSFVERSNESLRITKKFPDRIPVIIQPNKNCKLRIDKNKYLVPIDLTISQLLYTIRKKIKLDPAQALYFFIQESMPNSSVTLNQLYHTHRNQDGFLYITYDIENTFG
jgi:GABA(A) receptor-associated protein